MPSERNFDDYLRGAGGEGAAIERDDLRRSRVEAQYEAAVAEYNPLPRFSDPDPEAQAILHAAAIDAIGHQMADIITLPDGMSYADFEAMIFDDALTYADKVATQERERRSKVLTILELHELATQEPEVVNVDTLASLKKQLITDMIVIEEFERDSPWIHFVNTIIPGDHVDPLGVDESSLE